MEDCECLVSSRTDSSTRWSLFIGAVDLARYLVGHSGPEEQGFGEVMKPINTLVSRPRNRNTAHLGYSVLESRNR